LRVCLVFVIVELGVGEDLGDVKPACHVVPCVIIVNGEIGGVPAIIEPYSSGSDLSASFP
jgi:hypothetical protein